MQALSITLNSNVLTLGLIILMFTTCRAIRFLDVGFQVVLALEAFFTSATWVWSGF